MEDDYSDDELAMEDDYSDDEWGGRGCYYCGSAGFVVTCIDDICRGQGFCMHGDGDENCPVCNADGEREWINYGC